MKSFILTLVLALSAFAAPAGAAIEEIDGVRYVCEDGLCRIVEDDAGEASPRTEYPIAHGYMSEGEFLGFLQGDHERGFADGGLAMILLLTLAGGFLLNLTPCVLPMVPVNLLIIGRSFARGLVFAFGMTLGYGSLGIAAAVFGFAFGTIQASPWFNLLAAALFFALALSLLGVFRLGFVRGTSAAGPKSSFRVFLLGVFSALLAGSCVAPVVAAVLSLAAGLYAKGETIALTLPLLLGVGMALPWPFLGAGLRILPKPGAWMRHVNRLFAVMTLMLAFWYGREAWRAFAPSAGGSFENDSITAAEFDLESLPRDRPVLVECWATWCKNCAAMERLIALSPAIRRELERFSVLKVKMDDLSGLGDHPVFGAVKGLPAYIIIPSK